MKNVGLSRQAPLYPFVVFAIAAGFFLCVNPAHGESGEDPTQTQLAAVSQLGDVSVVWRANGSPSSVRGTGLARFSVGGGVAARPVDAAQSALAVLSHVAGVYRIGDAAKEFVLARVMTDRLGFTHVRLGQVHGAAAVRGGELTVHYKANGNAYEVSGAYFPDLAFETVRGVVDPAAAVAAVKADVVARGGGEPDVCEGPTLMVEGAWRGRPVLIYEVTVGYRTPTRVLSPVLYTVDAKSGRVLSWKSALIPIAAPTGAGSPSTVQGYTLVREGGAQTSLSGWSENGVYYLHNPANRWQVYNVATNGYSDSDTYAHRANSNWDLADRGEMSAARAADLVQHYYLDVHGRNGHDDAGTLVRANVHQTWRQILGIWVYEPNNAFWDPVSEEMTFGQGDDVEYEQFCVLDVVGHEFTHGVINHTADLIYQGESGALNESFADIFGTLVEFHSQPDARGSYPNVEPGKADWFHGEDCAKATRASRDFREPHGPYAKWLLPSRYMGSYWHDTSDPWDNGGVHINNGVQNHFFYLLCEGGQGDNDGITYNVQGIGIPGAGEVAYRALSVYFGPADEYAEARERWISAAADINPLWTNNVMAAWAAVGIGNAPAGAGGDSGNEIEYFAWNAIPSPQGRDEPFGVRIAARQANDATATTFTGTVALAGYTGGDGKVSVGTAPSLVSYPTSDFYHDERTQVIYPAAELSGAATFTNLSIYVASIPNRILNNFTIRMKHTALNNYNGSAQWETTDWTTVYEEDERILSSGWRKFSFDAPFAYDGVNNLMVDFSFNNSTGGGDLFAGRCRGTTLSEDLRVLWYRSNSANGDPLNWAGTVPSPFTAAAVPNIRLGSTMIQVPITPTLVGPFSGGSWDGFLTVQTNAQGVWLRADDQDGHTGDSNLFDVENRGRLLVYLLPTNGVAVPPNPQWRITTGPDTTWHEGGAIVGSLPASGSPYTVTFTDVPGWSAPDDISVQIFEGTLTITSVWYTIHTGTISIDVTPDQGTWTISSHPAAYVGPTLGTGDVTGLVAPIGSYTVDFGDIPGYSAPPAQTAQVLRDLNRAFVGNYVQFQGSLSIDVTPAAGSWQVSGYPLGYLGPFGGTDDLPQTGCPGGVYTVTYQPLAGYVTPAEQSLQVFEGTNTPFVGVWQDTNIVASGFITISVSRPEATWRITSHPAAYNYPTNGQGNLAQTVAPIGSYTVVYDAIPGYNTPAQQTLGVVQGAISAFTGNYTREVGAISITTVPTNGPWTVTLAPGDYAGPTNGVGALAPTAAPGGTYEVTYGVLPTYVTPPRQIQQVLDSQTTFYTGVWAQAFEFVEDFEPYTPGIDINGTNGWVAAPAGVALVTTKTVHGDTNALELGAMANLEHPFALAGKDVIWTEMFIQPVLRDMVLPPALDGTTTAGFFFDGNGNPNAYDGSGPGWTTYSGLTVVTGQWVNVVVKHDYAAKKWSLKIDGVWVASDFGFANAGATSYTKLKVAGNQKKSAYLDDVRIGEYESTVGALPFYEDFEAIPPGPLNGLNGWVGAPLSNVVVQTAVVHGGARAGEAASGTAAHDFYAPNARATKTDLWVRPAHRVSNGPPPVPVSGAVVLYVDADGMLNVYDGGGAGWTTLSHAPIPADTYVRLTVQQDFDLQLWSVDLNGATVGSGLGFATATPSFSQFRMDSLGAFPGYLDDLAITEEQILYQITASAGTGGSVTPGGVVDVVAGGNQAFGISADPGYRIGDVLVDGGSVGTPSVYTFMNVLEDHTISAQFLLTNLYTITASATGPGTIVPSGAVQKFGGADQTFAMLADPGSLLVRVEVDGTPIGVTTGYTFTAISANHTIQATFLQYSARHDFDGDGKTDPWVYDGPMGTWYILRSVDGTQDTWQFGWNGPTPVPADYDGDGVTDLALYNQPTGWWYILGSTEGYRFVGFGWYAARPVPADYDADARADLAVFEPGAFWPTLASTEGYRRPQFGWDGPTPVPADYDGDRRADLAVFDPATGNWYILRSQDGFIVSQFGWWQPTPVPADYDGDGRADLALYDQPTGTWYFLLSTAGFQTLQFGWSAADPMPGDYDGDRVTDIAVRGPDGMFYVWGSTDGFFTRQVVY